MSKVNNKDAWTTPMAIKTIAIHYFDILVTSFVIHICSSYKILEYFDKNYLTYAKVLIKYM